MRKIHRRAFSPLLLILLVTVSALLLAGCIQKPEEFYGSASSVTDVAGHVTLTLDASDVIGLSELIPEDGLLLPKKEYAFSEGETVLSLLLRVAQAQKLPVDQQGEGEASYLAGIGGLSGGDFGDMSGWLFFINGELPLSGAGAIPLTDGDEIRFLYTDSMTKYF